MSKKDKKLRNELYFSDCWNEYFSKFSSDEESFELGDDKDSGNFPSLRDYFAGAALQGLSARIPSSGIGNALPRELGNNAYKIADAMLAMRERM